MIGGVTDGDALEESVSPEEDVGVIVLVAVYPQ